MGNNLFIHTALKCPPYVGPGGRRGEGEEGDDDDPGEDEHVSSNFPSGLCGADLLLLLSD